MQRITTCSLAILMSLIASIAYGQGVLIVIDPPRPTPLPRPIRRPTPPPVSYKIKELAVNARVTDQIARVQVSQSFVNTGSRQMEVSFVFPLPYDGAIDQLTFMVDDKEIEAKLLPAKEARSIYEGYVRRNRDPALLEWIGYGMFKTSVFPVPAGAERKVTLRFSQLLRKERDTSDFLFPLSTAKYTSQPVEKVSIRASIETSARLKNVYSPTHPISTDRSDKHHAVVKYEAEHVVPASDFRLFFDTSTQELGASLLSFRPDNDEDGYFLLMATPDVKADDAARPKKTVIFVVDRSGSMSGKKIEQAKEALRFVLDNLREGDMFNIVAYDSSVESFRPELQRYSEKTRKAALGFVEGIYSGGSTNIDGALAAALGMIHDDSQPSFVIFLTDGKPTTGETNEAKIVARAKQANDYRARLVNFGVGYDVNSRLLDRLSRSNFGRSEYVRPDEDIETHVSRLYKRIGAPVMTNVTVEVDVDEKRVEHGKPVNRVYPRQVLDLFEGEQLVLVGRYRKGGQAKVVIKGEVGGQKQKFDFPAKLVKHSNDQSYGFIEKLWAMRRIGEIIDELDLQGKNDELIEELVALSTRHGILTPYTSFLADENSAPRTLADSSFGRERARRSLERLNETEGRAAFSQRLGKKALQEAELATRSSSFDRYAPADNLSAVPRGAAGGRAGAASKPAAAATPALRGGATYFDLDSDSQVAAESVQIVDGETLYKRGKLWIAASARDVDLVKDAAKIKVVERFSDDYFKLIRENTRAENAVLARQQDGEEMIVRLRGVVYRIK